jgi:hypothetical protein
MEVDSQEIMPTKNHLQMQNLHMSITNLLRFYFDHAIP